MKERNQEIPIAYPRLARLESTLAARFGFRAETTGVPREWAEYPLSWLCYGLRQEVIRKNSPMWRADVSSAVIDLFQAYYRPVVDEVSDKIGIKTGAKNVVSVFVQPDAMKPSTILIVQAGIGNLVHLNQVKARDLWFDSPADIEADLDDQFKAISRHMK